MAVAFFIVAALLACIPSPTTIADWVGGDSLWRFLDDRRP